MRAKSDAAIFVKCSSELRDRVEAIAARDQTSIATIVRQMIRDGLERRAPAAGQQSEARAHG